MQKEVKSVDYQEVLSEFPKTYDFLRNQDIQGIQRLDSLWRKENLLLKIDCLNENYVFKKINGKEKQSELERVKLFKEEYRGLMPEVFVFENNTYLMQYINGDSFFNLNEDKRVESIDLAGKIFWKSLSNK